MFFIKYASEEEETSVSLENLWRLSCVLDSVVGNVPFFFPQSVLYWVIMLRY